jgi:hypothetical protein
MELTNFIAGLINDGKVKVVPQLQAFEGEDLRLATVHLQQYYEDDIQEMPSVAPSFDTAAALWAARYLYTAVQFILLRNLDEMTMQEHLLPYTGEQTAAAMYSADLTLRYLPDLFDLAKGLSPNDPLVKQMKETAQLWPFSSAGIPIAENSLGEDLVATLATDLSIIFSHTSLKQAYIDRIIAAKDLHKCRQADCYPLVLEALGAYATNLWPQFEPSFND